MPLNIPAGYGVAALHWTGGPGTPEFITTMGVHSPDGDQLAVSQANRVLASAAGHLADIVASSIFLAKCSVTISDGDDLGSIDSDTPGVQCTGGSRTTPVAMSAVIQKRTATLGRKGRGRFFLPHAIPASNVTESGTLTEDYRTSLQSKCDGFLEDLTSPSNGDFIGDPVEAFLLHTDSAADPSPITALFVSSRVGWLRGRL